MRKQRVIQKFLAILAFGAFLSVGYLAMSVVTSGRAEAWCVKLCDVPNAVGSALISIGASVVSDLSIAEAQIAANFTVDSTDFTTVVSQTILSVTQNITDWIDTFWYDIMLPSLQQMTVQLSTMNADQARALGSFVDAANINRANKEHEEQQVISHRQQRPGENVCVAGTVTGGMTRATAFSRAYNAAAPAEKLGRSGNAVGAPSSVGAAADMNDRWHEYITRYCRADYNNGASGCGANMPFADQDIDVTGTLLMKDTIDLTNADTKTTVDDLITNIAEPFVKNPVPPGAVGSPAGQAALLEGESYKTRRQVIYDSLYHIVSRRAPGAGAGMNQFIKPLRNAAGVPNSMISQNPSRNEIMQAMMSERYRSGQYALGQVDEPENNQRELIIQQAFQLMQMSDQLDLMDRYALVMAAQASTEIRQAKTLGTAAEGAPLQ